MEFPCFDLLGVRFHAMTGRDLVDAAAKIISERKTRVIAHHNLHSLYLWGREPRMRSLYFSADYVHIDGMSLVMLGRLFGLPLKPEHRTTYVDLLPVLAREAAKRQWRLFYLGSRPGVAEKAGERLRTQYPGLQIVTRDGYFETDQFGQENQAVLKEIRNYAPDILLVGMGMPRQEIWLAENLKDIGASAIFCVGAMMDYVAGEIPTPPRWLGRLGLEWLYRLFSEPGRLWRRYLLEPWAILVHAMREYFRSGHLRLTADKGTEK